MIKIEVAYALPDEQVIISVEVTEGTTIEQAIQFSTVIEKFPEINLDALKVGIFGKLKKRNQALRAGDRIEIYRPLIADPKEVRKKRAAQGKAMKKGGGDKV
ncbi:MAG: RnfH family protein [Gammaproteobacteria bacterium]